MKKIRAERNDIWYNIKQIENPIDKLERGVASAARGNSSWIPVEGEDFIKNIREKENGKNN